MGILRAILLPVALLYFLATSVRNYLYDKGVKRSFTFKPAIISVGNLTVGGTGKTPMVEYLIQLLKNRYSIASLSRGYGRKTNGFRMLLETDDATTVGDESMQIQTKHPELPIAVGEKRALAIPQILHHHPETELILLDDAFQHRSVEADINILLTDYNRPFYSDYLMPVGNLRETRRGANRADLVLVTKCPPDISKNEMQAISDLIHPYVKKVPIFFATITHLDPVSFLEGSAPAGQNVILVTGIANPGELKRYAESRFTLLDHLKFRDHHHFTLVDLKRIKATYQKFKSDAPAILTTEKDMVRLKVPELVQYVEKLPLYFLPIQTTLLKSGRDFDATILESIQKILAVRAY